MTIACSNTKRNFYGCELSNDIYKVCINRVKEHIKELSNDIKFSYDELEEDLNITI
jgi:DNA modification methylase